MLATARILAESDNGSPTNASLCRAVSSGYYALFHCLALECANLFVPEGRVSPAWHQVYRALEHGFVKSQCRQRAVVSKFPTDIQAFALWFIEMQVKRHEADYDPNATFLKSDVMTDLFSIEETIRAFQATDIVSKRAFCIFVLLRDRKS